MNVTNATSAELEAMMAAARAVYSVGVPAMMVVCVCAIAVNGRCLAAIGWLRGQLSPTLLLSLSLAAADLHVSLLLLLSLVLNSYLPVVWAVVPARSACPQLALEALRLGGVLTLVAHLTALALNHHLGIIRPLRYPGIATGRNIRILLGVIWSVPPAGFLLYMFVPEGFLDECSGNSQFLEWFSFRVAFSALLVGPLAMMCCTYAHILWTVHVQTREWARGGATGGSYKHRGGKRSARSADPTGCAPANKQRSLMVSVRAVYTTMHILGSFVLLYLPAIVSFMLVCPQGCRYESFDADKLWINYIAQLLLIIKPLTNPVIYAARMHEVKEATRRMQAALRWRWCGGGEGAWPEVRRRPPPSTALCRLASNGTTQQPQATLVLNDTTGL